MIIVLYASYYKLLDHILMRVCDGLMSIPGILLAIALMASLGPKTQNVVIALSIVFTPYIARVIRSAAIVAREQTYIEAIRVQGASTLRIIWLHIMPNTISPLVVTATFIFADAIITEAALSFLGAGIPAPDPSWGNILYDGKVVIFNAWWMTVFPGIMIILSVLGLNLLGDGLRDLIDPHINQAKK
jgi:peptide/nickel transport system permease protein